MKEKIHCLTSYTCRWTTVQGKIKISKFYWIFLKCYLSTIYTIFCSNIGVTELNANRNQAQDAFAITKHQTAILFCQKSHAVMKILSNIIIPALLNESSGILLYLSVRPSVRQTFLVTSTLPSVLKLWFLILLQNGCILHVDELCANNFPNFAIVPDANKRPTQVNYLRLIL